MKFFTEKPLIEFIDEHPKYRVAIQDWASKIKRCEWECIGDIVNDFADAEIVDDSQCIFTLNIGKIKLTILTMYIGQYVYVRDIVRG